MNSVRIRDLRHDSGSIGMWWMFDMFQKEPIDPDNIFGLTERQIKRIAPYVDPNHPDYAKKRPADTLRVLKQRKDGTYSALDDFVAENIGRTVTSAGVASHLNTRIRPSGLAVYHILLRDGRFKRVEDTYRKYETGWCEVATFLVEGEKKC